MAMMQDLVANDNHPPGYQTILYFVMKWFGDGETIIRMPSIIAGIATVYMVYHIGKKLLSLETGALAAFIVACSYQSIFYSQEARAYALLVFFCLWNTYYFLKLFIVEHTTNKNILLFTATGAGCVFLHYAGLLFIICQLFLLIPIIVFSKNKKVILTSAACAYGILALLYLKWIPVMIVQIHHDEFYWEETPTLSAVFGTIRYLLGPDDIRLVMYASEIILAVCASGNAIYRYRDRDNREPKIVLAIFFLVVVPLALSFIKSSISASIYTNRYFIFTIPLLSLLAGYGIASAIKWVDSDRLKQSALIASVIFICATGLLLDRNLYIESLGKQDFRGAVKIVAEDNDFLSKSGTVIASHEFFDYYLKKFNVAEHAQGYLLFPGQLPQTFRKINTLGKKTFYYLEVAPMEQTPINQQLYARYHRISYQRVMEINVIKYEVTEE